MNTIGSIIGEALVGKSTVERVDIAAQLGIGRRTLDAVILGKSNLTFDQVGKLSDILRKDLFRQYLAKNGRLEQSVVNEPDEEEYNVKRPELTLNFALKSQLEGFGNFQGFLTDLRKLTAKHGFELI